MFKLRFIPLFCMVAVSTAFAPGLGTRTIVAAKETAQVPEEDVQVLSSGPIHEAFAEAVALDPVTGIVAPKAPPARIEEITPEQKPEGKVQWIPGYWAWDDERNDFIWVSGVWRVPPPGRQWIPGYWKPVSAGYQRISGYWASAKVEVTEYLPEPPKSVEIGPSSHAPSTDYTWIPGCWIWHGGRYAWRPGYWAVVKPDWIWVPDHYIWTPRGYIFIGGYWDYVVIHRGVLFAPVFFPTRFRLGLTISFSPGVVIDLSVFDDGLFLRLRYCHYYYGDYYAPKYYGRGIYPWFSRHANRIVYDPIYAHQRWTHRNDHEWENRLQARFRERRENEGFRSPKSFEHRTDRQKFLKREKEVQAYNRERRIQEIRRPNIPDERASTRQELNRENFSRSPTMERSNEKAERNIAPPAQYKGPKPKPKVGSLNRINDSSHRLDELQRSEDWRQKAAIRNQHSMADIRKPANRGVSSGDHMQKSDRQPQRRDEGRQRQDQRLPKRR